MKLILIIAFIIGLLLLSYFYETIISNQFKLEPADAKLLIQNNKDLVIIDVRTSLERRTLGSYPNSVHIFLLLEKEIQNKIPNKETPILAYANSGRRARLAAEKLYSLGYKNVNYIVTPYNTLL